MQNNASFEETSPCEENTRAGSGQPAPMLPDTSEPPTFSGGGAVDADAVVDDAAEAQGGNGLAARPSPSLITPLRRSLFRAMWLVWLTANSCMWMNDVAAAWLMTSLTSSPVLVALVQTASTLPVFLLGLPSGALADILDRRKYFIFTQVWVATVAVVLFAAVMANMLGPWLLLALVFTNGIGLAFRWPVFSAIVPELVPRSELPSALALNAVAMNISRIIGPLLAGFIIARAGALWVFLLNAVLSIVCAFAIVRWRRIQQPSALERERLFTAMRVGAQFVMQSPQLRAVTWRMGIFFLHAAALLGLLPLVAQDMPASWQSATVYTVMLASLGVGAILGALILSRLRQAFSRDALVMRGMLAVSMAIVAVALTQSLWIAAPALVVAGVAWMSTTNSLMVSAQFTLPDWVRARGMSIFQMTFMGTSAAGAAWWGYVSSLTNVHMGLCLCAASAVVLMAVTIWLSPDKGVLEDLSRSDAIAAPSGQTPEEQGHVVTTVEYIIDPQRAKAFRLLMQESRRSRLRQGAIAWELLHDIKQPVRYVERIVDETWIEHLRRFERVTAADVALRERKMAFHTLPELPRVERFIVDGRMH